MSTTGQICTNQAPWSLQEVVKLHWVSWWVSWLDWVEFDFQYHSKFPQLKISNDSTSDSTSVSNMTSDSSFRLVAYCFSYADSITSADFIWCSQTPPIWFLEGGLFFHISSTILQETGILSSSMSESDLWSSDLLTTKLVSLSHLISFMFPRCAINLLSVWINDSVSMFCTTSRCTTRFDR